MSSRSRVVEIIIQGRNLAGQAIASAASGLARVRSVAAGAFSGVRGHAAAAAQGVAGYARTTNGAERSSEALADAIRKLEIETGDLNYATRNAAAAMDLAERTGESLERAINAVAAAHRENTREGRRAAASLEELGIKIDRVQDEAEQATSALRRMSSAAGSVVRGFTERIGQRLFDGVLSFVYAFAAGIVDAGMEAETVATRLRGTIQGIGMDVSLAWGEVREMAEAIQDSTAWGDDEALQAMDAILGRTRDYRFALRETALAIDIAAKKGKTASEAGDLLGKAYQGNSKALKALGVDATTTQGRMAQLHRMFDGAAAQQLATYEGKVRDVKDEYGEMQEAAAAKVIPILAALIDAFKKNRKEVGQFGTALWGVTRFIAGVVAQAFDSVASIIAGVMAGAVSLATTAWYGLGTAIGYAVVAQARFRATVGLASEETVANAEAFLNRMRAGLEQAGNMFTESARLWGSAFSTKTFRAVWNFEGADGPMSWGGDPGPDLDPFDADAGKEKNKDPERERIDALLKAAELGALSNEERAEAVRLEAAINARVVAGIADTERRVSALEKLRDLETIRQADAVRGLELLERANAMQAVTPQMLIDAREAQARLNAEIAAMPAPGSVAGAAGAAVEARRVALTDLARNYEEAVGAALDNRIAAIERANDAYAMSKAQLEEARDLLLEQNNLLGAGTLIGKKKLEAQERVRRLEAAIQGKTENELALLEQTAQQRALNSKEMARLAKLTGDINVLQGESLGNQRRQLELKAMQARVTALHRAEQAREVGALVQLRELRRLTPDERMRVNVLRVQLEHQIAALVAQRGMTSSRAEAVRLLEEEIRLRNQLAGVAPESNGQTREERDQEQTALPSWDNLKLWFDEAAGASETLSQAIRDNLVGAMNDVEDATGTALQAWVNGAATGRNVWKAYGQAARDAIAKAATSQGQFFAAEAVGAVAKFAVSGNPKFLLAAAKYTAAAMAMFKIGGASGGGGGASGGGGGGRDSGSSPGDRLAGSGRQRREVVIRGSGAIMLDTTAGRDALMEIIREAGDDDVDIRWSA